MNEAERWKFVAVTVCWRVLDQTIAELHSQFGDPPGDELAALIDETTTAADKIESLR